MARDMLGKVRFLLIFLIGCTPRSGDYVTVQCPDLRPPPVLCAPCEQKVCPDCSLYLDLFNKSSKDIESCLDAKEGLLQEIRRAKENEEFWKNQYDSFHCSAGGDYD